MKKFEALNKVYNKNPAEVSKGKRKEWGKIRGKKISDHLCGEGDLLDINGDEFNLRSYNSQEDVENIVNQINRILNSHVGVVLLENDKILLMSSMNEGKNSLDLYGDELTDYLQMPVLEQSESPEEEQVKIEKRLDFWRNTNRKEALEKHIKGIEDMKAKGEVFISL